MRTTKGSARNKAKNRLYKKAKGYVGGRGTLLPIATAKYESVISAVSGSFESMRRFANAGCDTAILSTA